MPIEMEDRGKALEDEYFRRQEKELLEKMRAKIAAEQSKEGKRVCAAGCEVNLKEVDFENVKIDVCEKCGGVWLDAGELAILMNNENKAEEKGWFGRLLG